jgi:hypothetical protein
MELLVVMAQREEHYEGQFGPEALAVMTGHNHADNPDYLQKILKDARNSGEYAAVELVRLRVNNEAITAALFPNREAIAAKVLP